MLKKRDTRTSDDSSLRARYFPPSWRISFRGPHIHAYIYKERMEREEERSSGRSSLDRPERLFRVAVINKIDPSKLRSFIAASRLSRDYPRISLPSPSEPWKGQWADVRTRANIGQRVRHPQRVYSIHTLIPRVIEQVDRVSRAIETVPCQRLLFSFSFLFYFRFLPPLPRRGNGRER